MLKSFTHSGNIIIAGFVLMIMMMSTLVYKTMQQNIDMVSEGDYFKQELKYQQKIDGADKSKAFGDSFRLEQKNGQMILSLPINLSNNIDSGKLIFYCNSDGREDKQFSIEAAHSGTYGFDISSWKKTTYTLKADIYANGEYYYQQQIIMLQ